MLAINCPKTEILFVPFNKDEDACVYIMNEDGEVIESSGQVKILGVRFNSSNNLNAHVSALSSSVGMAYNKIKPYIVNASPKQRRIILKAKIESIALYAAPLAFNESESIKKRLENLIMRVYKWIYQKPTFIKKYEEICAEIGVDSPKQQILKTNTKYITKIMHDREVDQILNQLKINNRLGSTIYFRNPHKVS